MKAVIFTYLLPVGLINLGNAFAFAFQFLLARSLSVADYGNFNSLFAIINLLASAASSIPFAISRTMILYEATPGSARTVIERSTAATCFGAFAIMFVGVAFSSPISSLLRIDDWLTEALSLALLATSFSHMVAVGWLQGVGRYIVSAAALAAVPIARFLLGASLLWAGYANIHSALAATALPGLLVFLAGLIAMRSVFAKPSARLGSDAFRDFIRFSAIVSVSSLLLMGFWNLDLVLIRVRFSEETAGLYAVAAVLGRIPLLVSAAIVNVLFPETTRAGNQSGAARSVLLRSLTLATILGAGTAIPIALAAEPLILIFAGVAYADAAHMLRILAPAMAIFATLQVLVTFMIARNQNHVLWLLAAGLGAFVAACSFAATNPLEVAWILIAVVTATFAACFALAMLITAKTPQSGSGL